MQNFLLGWSVCFFFFVCYVIFCQFVYTVCINHFVGFYFKHNICITSLVSQVVKRGMAPGGGGEVHFSCPVRRTIKPVQLTDPSKIKRIRGTAYP